MPPAEDLWAEHDSSNISTTTAGSRTRGREPMSSGVSTATAATMSRLTNDICGIRSHPKSCDVHAVAGLGALSRLSPETSSRYT